MLGKLILCALVMGLPVSAQSVISAVSGLVYHVEGQTFLNESPVENQKGRFVQMREQQTLRTGQGRAEVLLAPDIVVRLGEGSAVRLLSELVLEPVLQLISGSAVLEVSEIKRGGLVTVHCGAVSVTFGKPGLYRMRAEPAEILVYDGRAVVTSGGRRVSLDQGKALSLDGGWETPADLQTKTDALDQWAAARSRLLASERTETGLEVHAGKKLASGWWPASISAPPGAAPGSGRRGKRSSDEPNEHAQRVQ
jgi:hypothetical protein